METGEPFMTRDDSEDRNSRLATARHDRSFTSYFNRDPLMASITIPIEGHAFDGNGDGRHERISIEVRSERAIVSSSREPRIAIFGIVPSHEWLTGFHRFNSNELPTTETELSAIAAPASTGFISPTAASGTPSTL